MDKRNKFAAARLKSAEQIVGEKSPEKKEKVDDSLGAAREAEENAGGYYSGSEFKYTKNKETNKARVRGGGFFKRKGPVAFILMLVCGAGGIMAGGQLMQPFSLVEQFRESFNSMQISTRTRANSMLRYQLDPELVKNPIKSRLFRADTFKISKRQAQKLAPRGIEYDDDFEGTGTRVLKYNDGSGEIKIIAADKRTVAKLNEMDLSSRFSSDGIRYNATAETFAKMYTDDPLFGLKYDSGSTTWRGAISNWFGSLTDKFLGMNRISRNLFVHFKEQVADNDGDIRGTAVELMEAGRTELDDGGGRVSSGKQEVEPVKDENGNVIDEVKRFDGMTTAGGGSGKSKVVMSAAEVKQKLEAIKSNYASGQEDGAGGIVGIGQKIANAGCLVFNFMGSVSMLVAASEAAQIISLVTSYFEAIDKVKAGDGADSPINTLTDGLNVRKTSTYATVDASGKNVESSSTSKSAMESSGIISTYSGNPVNPNDPSVKSFNITSSLTRFAAGIGVGVTAFEGCAFAKVVTNAASIGVDIATKAKAIADIGRLALNMTPFGIVWNIAEILVGDLALKAIGGITVSITLGALIGIITPVVTSMLTRNLIANLGGEDLGNALTSGANMYQGKVHRGNGGSLASSGKYLEFALARQQVIAENARYERATRSPFDMTSKYTFMGAIANKLMGIYTSSSIIGAIMSAGSVLSSAISSLSPTSSAYDIVKNLPSAKEYEETCPYLASLGAVGDAFCNPYVITDMSTIDMDPSEVIEKIKDNFIHEGEMETYYANGDETDKREDNIRVRHTSDELSFASTGNVKIDASSELAKYILYCNNRESPFGIADQNIANQVGSWGQVNTNSSTFNNVANAAIGAIPIVGDLIDVVSNSQQLANAGYISGQSCVAGYTADQPISVTLDDAVAAKHDEKGKVTEKAHPPIMVHQDDVSHDWEVNKYYQRFIEDQSLMESMGIIEESAVTAFLNDYYEQNPVDNSYEGILARYSGLTKDNVIALLDIIEYGNYIAEYDASERYAFGEDNIDLPEKKIFDNDNVVAETYYILPNTIVYADVRNKQTIVV